MINLQHGLLFFVWMVNMRWITSIMTGLLWIWWHKPELAKSGTFMVFHVNMLVQLLQMKMETSSSMLVSGTRNIFIWELTLILFSLWLVLMSGSEVVITKLLDLFQSPNLKGQNEEKTRDRWDDKSQKAIQITRWRANPKEQKIWYHMT